MVDTGPFGSVKATIFRLLYRNPKSNGVVAGLAGLTPTDRLLDIGCGAGAALAHAARIVTDGHVAGVDPTEKLARLTAARVPTATVEVAGAEALPFADDAFTVAWSISAYHHWPDPVAGLAEAFRVVEKGGRLIIAEGHKASPGGHGLDDSEVEQLVERLAAVGFGEPTVSHPDAGRKRLVMVTATA